MNKISEIKFIYENLSLIIEFFVPGLIFVTSFQFFTSKKISKYNVLYSIGISYILKAIFSILHKSIFIYKNFQWSERAIILCIVAFLLSIVFVIASETNIVKKILTKINHKAVHDDIWLDVIDYKNGTTLKIDTNNGSYIGVLFAHEEKGTDSWFILEDYHIEEDEYEYNGSDLNKNAKIAINLKDVKHIEIFTN